MSARVLALAMALSCIALSMRAPADEQTEKERLERLAVEAYEKGDYARAAELYGNIAALVPGPIPLHNRGLALERAGERARAAAVYAEALALAESDEDIRARLTARLDALRPQLGRLRVEEPKGAKISVGDGPAHTVPIDVFVEPGTVNIVLTPQQGKRVERTVRVGAGETLLVDLLVPSAKPKPQVRPARPRTDAPLDIRIPIGATLLGLAGGGTAAAIALNVRTHDLLEAYCPTYESGECFGSWEQYDETIAYRNATFAVAGITGALAVTGVALLIASAIGAPEAARSDGLAIRF